MSHYDTRINKEIVARTARLKYIALVQQGADVPTSHRFLLYHRPDLEPSHDPITCTFSPTTLCRLLDALESLSPSSNSAEDRRIHVILLTLYDIFRQKEGL
jgi:hypothetical protein